VQVREPVFAEPAAPVPELARRLGGSAPSAPAARSAAKAAQLRQHQAEQERLQHEQELLAQQQAAAAQPVDIADEFERQPDAETEAEEAALAAMGGINEASVEAAVQAEQLHSHRLNVKPEEEGPPSSEACQAGARQATGEVQAPAADVSNAGEAEAAAPMQVDGSEEDAARSHLPDGIGAHKLLS
jgi:hypothetical protein